MEKLNLNNPILFTEKLQWLKLNNYRPDFTSMVDKCDAKEYVANIIGKNYIIPTLGVYNSFDEIDFATLPKQFVLKCTHNSGGIVICKDKEQMNYKNARKLLMKYLHINPFWGNWEYPYKNVHPRIIAEQYMVNGNDQELKDYKFYCFHGRAEFCQVIANRSSNETKDFYDREWKHQNFIGFTTEASFVNKQEKMPDNYKIMLDIADELSSTIDTEFVRIVLYSINHRVYFGEITFLPNTRLGSFNPRKWNEILGNMIHLPN